MAVSSCRMCLCMDMHKIIGMKQVSIFVLLCIQSLIIYIPSHAQMKGDHLLGQVGLQSGTQGPPGLNLVVIPVYLYSASKLKNDKGSVVDADLNLNSYVAAAGLTWVLDKKILGANIGGSVLLPFVTNKIEANETSAKTSFAYSDSYIQPIQLGWHGKRLDYIASFNLYIPTGKYEQGGDNNSGLGMWAYEFSGGATLYFDKEKSWHFSSLLSYELNSKKKGTDLKAGDILSIEGWLIICSSRLPATRYLPTLLASQVGRTISTVSARRQMYSYHPSNP
jgi:hypothetical protein